MEKLVELYNNMFMLLVISSIVIIIITILIIKNISKLWKFLKEPWYAFKKEIFFFFKSKFKFKSLMLFFISIFVLRRFLINAINAYLSYNYSLVIVNILYWVFCNLLVLFIYSICQKKVTPYLNKYLYYIKM